MDRKEFVEKVDKLKKKYGLNSYNTAYIKKYGSVLFDDYYFSDEKTQLAPHWTPQSPKDKQKYKDVVMFERNGYYVASFKVSSISEVV